MVVRLATAVLAVFLAAEAGAEDLCGGSFASIQELREQIARGPGTERLPMQSGEPFEAFSEGQSKTWTFVVPPHRAAPSVACRELLQQGGTFYVETKLSCRASKAVCDALFESFRKLDEAMTRTLEKPR